MNAEHKTHVFTYRHDGAEWELAIQATDADDARRRIGMLAYATYNGVSAGSMPIILAPLGIASVWLKNAASSIVSRFRGI